MNREEQKVFDVVESNPGIQTAEVARMSRLESSDSKGGHQNWKVHHILESLEKRKILKSEKSGRARSSPRHWSVMQSSLS